MFLIGNLQLNPDHCGRYAASADMLHRAALAWEYLLWFSQLIVNFVFLFHGMDQSFRLGRQKASSSRTREQSSLLLIDLHGEIIKACKRSFSKYRIDAIQEPKDISAEIWKKTPDLVLIDPFSGSQGGLATIAELGAGRHAPFIIVSKEDDPIDRAISIELGACDYISVPFFEREFVARVRRALMTSEQVGSRHARSGAFVFDRIRVDLDQRTTTAADGQKIDLTPAEFDLLAAFVRSPQQVLSREKLAKQPISDHWDGSVRAVDVLVAKLRRKLSAVSSEDLITTVRNSGYMLSKPVTRD